MSGYTELDRAAGVLIVDLDALADNWRALARRVGPAACGAVVKADAYGLGATPVVRVLLQAGCREFFVALVDEGIRLRESLAGEWPPQARLHVLHGPRPGAEADCVAYGLVPVLNSVDQVARWQALAHRSGRHLSAALHVDTGMTRLGLPPAALGRLADAAGGLAGITATLVMSHLVGADRPDDPMNYRQLALFRPLRARFPAALACLAHSAGIFLGPDFQFDLVRPGAALYGLAPVAGQPNPMRRVVQVQLARIDGADQLHDIEALSQQSGTTACEALTRLGSRHPRQYRGGVPVERFAQAPGWTSGAGSDLRH